MRIVIDVSERFEPGAESIGDFMARGAQQLSRLANTLNTAEFDGDVEKAIEFLGEEVNLLAVEGEY